MGARPIAMLNRCASVLSIAHEFATSFWSRQGHRRLLELRGIPTVAGEIVFDPATRTIAGQRDVRGLSTRATDSRQGRRCRNRSSQSARALAVMEFTRFFASEDLRSKRRQGPASSRDPFTEKLLLEASRELIKSGQSSRYRHGAAVSRRRRRRWRAWRRRRHDRVTRSNARKG